MYSMYNLWLFKLKQTLQAANTDIFNPLVPKAHNSERKNLQFPLQINPLSPRVWK